MRTLIFVVLGVAVAALVLRSMPGSSRTLAAGIFTAFWLGVSVWNLRVGLSHGYTLAQELPIHLVLFGVPAAAAWGFWWLWRA